ncbi:TetR/AcrR family transcriptional regulator [Cupriavidus sp. 2SB]|uniref:TetR/AcrR family transcriptional regulator n=1 Tax=Cupriavidus sp. 2SB TaxID=2502199 RepID=UPI002017D743|nr:TetR/AcrR family transcriptional regulator [Cupriavidus sp. 2SB]
MSVKKDFTGRPPTLELIPTMECGRVKRMNSKPLTRTQRRAAEMRRSIIDVAAALVAEQGAAALTTEEVARRADVALQTVYNRVGGKPALLLAITELALEENRKFVDEAYDSQGTANERIERAGVAYVRFALERPHQFRVMSNPPDDPASISRVVGLIREQTGRLAAALREAVQAGEAEEGLDAEAAAIAMWGMMNGVLNLAVRTDSLRIDDNMRDRVIDTAITLIRQGLQSPKGSKQN